MSDWNPGHSVADRYDNEYDADARPTARGVARRLDFVGNILIGFVTILSVIGVGGGVVSIVLGASGSGYVNGNSVSVLEIYVGLASVVLTVFVACWMLLIIFWAQAFARSLRQ